MLFFLCVCVGFCWLLSPEYMFASCNHWRQWGERHEDNKKEKTPIEYYIEIDIKILLQGWHTCKSGCDGVITSPARNLRRRPCGAPHTKPTPSSVLRVGLFPNNHRCCIHFIPSFHSNEPLLWIYGKTHQDPFRHRFSVDEELKLIFPQNVLFILFSSGILWQ